MERAAQVGRCPHLDVGTINTGRSAIDEYGRPEYYEYTARQCNTCGEIEPQIPTSRLNNLPKIEHIQMDMYLRASIMKRHGFIFTPSGKSIKCSRCGQSYGIRHYKKELNHQLLQHAAEHERKDYDGSN